jgi:uncharacterized CHY-type Zn-finger protein
MEDDFSVLTKKRQKHHHFVNHHQFGAFETISINENIVICGDCQGTHLSDTGVSHQCNLPYPHPGRHWCDTCRVSFGN